MRKLLLGLLTLLLLVNTTWAGTVTPAPDVGTYSLPGQTFQKVWTPLTTTNPTGVAWDCRKVRSMSVFATGTWGGASLALQGSIVSSSAGFVALRTISQTAIAITADSTIVTVVFDSPVGWVKPVLTGGDGTTSITCTVMGVN